jgi:Transglycosylase-like domain
VLSRKTALAATGAALAGVPTTAAAAPHGLEAQAVANRARANVLRDGAIAQRAERAHRTLVADNVRLAHKVAHARGHEVDHDHADRVRAFTRPRLRAENRVLSRKLRKLQGANAGGSASPQLEAIAACESGGDPHSIGGGGAFRGKYQFTYGTWASVGGEGDPAAAPEAEQDKRAQMLLDKSGTSPWPVCGQ